MKKIVKFSKPYEIEKIKKDFYENNKTNLDFVNKINTIYSRQPKRNKCKNCNTTLRSADFKTFGVKYVFCNKCTHLNGLNEDTDKFINFLYKDNSGKNYSKNYSKDFNDRVDLIYNPKLNFLKSVIKKKNINILDIGAGAGHFLKACENSNIKAYGLEPNKKLCNLANKFLKKNKIQNINLTDLYIFVENTNANCISLIGVLEHLQKPRKLLNSFLKSSANYIYFSVPLFSLTVLFENIHKDIFPRHLSGAHTHLYTEESINFLMSDFNLKIIGEWWFGTDIADLYRQFFIKNTFNKNHIFDKYLKDNINDLQNVLDRKKICSEVHIIAKKK